MLLFQVPLSCATNVMALRGFCPKQLFLLADVPRKGPCAREPHNSEKKGE